MYSGERQDRGGGGGYGQDRGGGGGRYGGGGGGGGYGGGGGGYGGGGSGYRGGGGGYGGGGGGYGGGGGRSRGGFGGQDDENAKEITIQSCFTGRIIGKGGSKIRELQDESGCKIQVLKDGDTSTEQVIKLVGDPDGQARAQMLIEELCVDRPRDNYNSRGGGRNDGY